MASPPSSVKQRSEPTTASSGSRRRLSTEDRALEQIREEQRQAFLRKLVGPWVPHVPTIQQEKALREVGKREILYGGAAGGGKTDWLLMEALRYVDVPGYSALILRRTFPQLSQADGPIARSLEWLSSTQAVYNKGQKRWTFPSGAILDFGHIQYEDDKYNFQGGAWQCVCFDELTQFNQSQYLYLHSRLRGPAEGTIGKVPRRIRAASNPGGVGHDWVRDRFLQQDDPTRMFVPAKLNDNPYLDREQYAETLMNLDPLEREQLLEGNWDARPSGGRFKREWFHVLDTIGDFKRIKVRAWDLAASEPKAGRDPDYTVGTLMSIDDDNRVYVEDVVRFRSNPGELDRKLREIAQIDGYEVPIFIEREGGSAGKIALEHLRSVLVGYSVTGDPPTGKKEVRAGPFASWAESGRVYVLRSHWNESWFRELEQFTGRDDAHDDQVDSASLAFTQCKIKKRGPITWGSRRGGIYRG